MNILIVTPWFPSHRHDQKGNFILDSIESLIDAGHEVTVLVTLPYRPKIAGKINSQWKENEILESQFSNRFNLHIKRYFSIPRSYFLQFSLYNYIIFISRKIKQLTSETKFDLIHAHTELAGMAVVKVSKQLYIPSVITLHGISTDKALYKKNIRAKLFETPLKSAERVILVGEPIKSFYQQFVDNVDHFRIVHNGFRFAKQHNTDSHKNFSLPLRFISVSNLVEGKGVDLTLKALATINKNISKRWNYTIIGDGDQKTYLEALVKELKLQDKVTFVGKLPHNKVYEYLEHSDIFVLPSYREAFGIAYLEAMSCGLLTIGVKGEGPSTFIQHGHSGYLVEPKNVKSLTQLITEIFHSLNAITDIAETGKKQVHQHFTWEAHAKNLENIYRELV